MFNGVVGVAILFKGVKCLMDTFIYGLEPVHEAMSKSFGNKKPPAMRVGSKSYTKTSFYYRI
jgi:hypothetical protein